VATTTTTELDCRECGACCVNPPANRADGYVWWVEVYDGDAILERAELVKRLVVLDDQGVPHLRLTRDGRCKGLRGVMGRDVKCGIYEARPTPCRTVMPGDELCLKYRRAHGFIQ
jgi:hypothetical protein